MSGGRFDRSLLPSLSSYLQELAIAVNGRGYERRCNCPLAAHSSKLTLCFNADTGAWWCHACGTGGGDALALHQAITGQGFLEGARKLGAIVGEKGTQDGPARLSRPVRTASAPDPAQLCKEASKKEDAGRLWRLSIPLIGTAGEAYLIGRGCRLPPPDSDLRFLQDLGMWGFSGPCLAGRVSMAQNASRGIGLHLTWLHQIDSEWRRLDRRYLGKKSRGVVRLWPDESVTMGLAVAEGIETSLAAAHAFTPVWACMDAGNLAAFPILDGIGSLTIFADNDASGTGQKAAAECADCWLGAGREVNVMLSDVEGFDVADEVMS